MGKKKTDPIGEALEKVPSTGQEIRPSGKQNDHPDDISRKISELQAAKLQKELAMLDLELKNKYKSNPKGLLITAKELLPTIIAILTIVGSGITIKTYFDNKKREYDVRLSADLIANVNTLLADSSSELKRENAIYMLSNYQNDAVDILLHTFEKTPIPDNTELKNVTSLKNIIRSLRFIKVRNGDDKDRFVYLVERYINEFHNFSRKQTLEEFTAKYSSGERLLFLVQELDLANEAGIRTAVVDWGLTVMNEIKSDPKMLKSNYEGICNSFARFYGKNKGE